MKKSGTRPRRSLSRSAPVGLLDVTVAPQADEVAAEILTERDHLALERTAQLPHQLLVSRGRRTVDDAAAERPEHTTACGARRERVSVRLKAREVGPRP